jgi:predicted ATP-dependent endonuclease of OLD family
MLSNIKIERFKSIDHVDLDLSKINVLIGSNNSGKSSIQQAIQFAISVAQSSATINARWRTKGDRCPSSLSRENLIF